MSGYMKRISAALFSVALAFMMFPGSSALGADIIVDTLSEDVLKNAISSATSADVVRITAEGTIPLSSEIVISGSVKIVGPGQEKLVISGQNLCRVFYVTATASADISGLSIVSGDAGGSYGGGIFNASSNLAVTHCTFSGNRSTDWFGGGMYNNYASPTVTHCTFSGNSAHLGGGMYNNYASPIVTHCTFSGNSAHVGGGMLNDYASPTVTNCTFSGNSATDFGGGMCNFYSSSPTVTNCTFSGNSAGLGGGTYNLPSSSPTVTNTIFWDLAGGEIYNESPSFPTLNFCVVRNGDVGTGTISSNIISADPLLGSLADNGGPTMTCAIPSNSSAFDAGTGSGAPATDQRGISRPQGLGVDIGAYEYMASLNPLVLVSPADTSADVAVLPTLSWETSPDLQGVTFEVYMGTAPDALALVTDAGITDADFSPATALEFGTTYYWRVDQRFGSMTASGDVWSFTTEEEPNGKSSGGCQVFGFSGLMVLLLPLTLLLKKRN